MSNLPRELRPLSDAEKQSAKKNLIDQVFNYHVVYRWKWKEIADYLGVEVEALKELRRSPLWRKLLEDSVETVQREVMAGIAANGELMIEAAKKILIGENVTKGAAAQVNLIKLFMETSEAPITRRKDAMTAQVLNQKIGINIDMKRLASMTQEELIEFNLTGIMPARVKQIETLETDLQERMAESPEKGVDAARNTVINPNFNTDGVIDFDVSVVGKEDDEE